jgi:MFS family permease
MNNIFDSYSARYSLQSIKDNILLIITACIIEFALYGIFNSVFAGTYDTNSIFGETRPALAFSQTLGLTVGKLIAFMWLSRTNFQNKISYITIVYFCSIIPFIIFGFFPGTVQVFMIFISGVFTSFMWGFLICYIEGRLITDLAILFVYFAIISALGVSKTVGALIINSGISENFMPIIVSSVSFVIATIFSYLLTRLSKPSVEETMIKSVRSAPIDSQQETQFLKKYYVVIICFICAYSFSTIYQSFRNYYSLEIWQELYSYDFDPKLYSRSELISSIISIPIFFGVFFLKSETKKLYYILFAMIFGGIIILISTLIYVYVHQYDPMIWIILVSTGNYLTYVPCGCMLYDKLMSVTNTQFTATYVIYLSEFSASLSSLISLFMIPYLYSESYVTVFINMAYVTSSIIIICVSISIFYFYKKIINGREYEGLNNEKVDNITVNTYYI